MNIASIGIDLGKTSFHLVALDDHTKVDIKKKFSRKQLLAYTATLLLKSCLRNDHVYPLRPHRGPMTASAFSPFRPTEKWQHRFSSRTPNGTELP
jgi:hypothetical protein